jgi:hypothetical protein
VGPAAVDGGAGRAVERPATLAHARVELQQRAVVSGSHVGLGERRGHFALRGGRCLGGRALHQLQTMELAEHAVARVPISKIARDRAALRPSARWALSCATSSGVHTAPHRGHRSRASSKMAAVHRTITAKRMKRSLALMTEPKSSGPRPWRNRRAEEKTPASSDGALWDSTECRCASLAVRLPWTMFPPPRSRGRANPLSAPPPGSRKQQSARNSGSQSKEPSPIAAHAPRAATQLPRRPAA